MERVRNRIMRTMHFVRCSNCMDTMFGPWMTTQDGTDLCVHCILWSPAGDYTTPLLRTTLWLPSTVYPVTEPSEFDDVDPHLIDTYLRAEDYADCPF